MFRDVSFGQYYPTNSVVHRLDARVKLVLTLMYVIGIFFVKSDSFHRPDILPEAFAVMVKIKHPALRFVKFIAGF